MTNLSDRNKLIPGYWFSRNPDKAWAEKFFLTVVPFWFVYNMVMVQMGWLNTGNFWNITQNVLMWVPYCVLLPWFLRRKSGVSWHESYWFKFNLYMFWWVFLATYFHTEYFFEVLGLRYRFPEVTLYLDSALVGPDEATALETFQKVPPSMYFNSIVFFTVYHVTAIIALRRLRTMTTSWQSPSTQWVAWWFLVAVVSLFWAWGETYFYFVIADNDFSNVWYENLDAMLVYGSIYYALYFVVAFPNLYRLDEEAEGERWGLGRVLVEASFVGVITLLLIDLATHVMGGSL
jgi:cycloeucalenol cycloisomerase